MRGIAMAILCLALVAAKPESDGEKNFAGWFFLFALVVIAFGW